MVLCFSCYLQWYSREFISLPYFLGSSGAIEAILPNRLHIFKPLSHPVKLILLPYFRWCLLKVNRLRLPVYCTGNVNLSGFLKDFSLFILYVYLWPIPVLPLLKDPNYTFLVISGSFLHTFYQIISEYLIGTMYCASVQGIPIFNSLRTVPLSKYKVGIYRKENMFLSEVCAIDSKGKSGGGIGFGEKILSWRSQQDAQVRSLSQQWQCENWSLGMKLELNI